MFRKTRTVATLIRHLTLGTAATLGAATLATSFVGCKDESQPDYWVDKLQDGKWRAKATKRLDQFYQDALTKAGSKNDSPEVKALVDKLIEPLNTAYIDGYADYDSKTRVSLIKLIASFRDPRTAPALKKALAEFAKKPTERVEEEDIKWAIRAQNDLKLPELSPLMLEVFLKLKTSGMLGGIVYKDLNDAMINTADKAWSADLRKALDAEIIPPNEADKESVPKYRDQLFWQSAAAQCLGELGDASAVEPLIKVVLDPAKGDLATTAILALVKIGKPAAEGAVRLMRGENKPLADFHIQRLMKVAKMEKPPEDEPYVALAAVIAGACGRPEVIGPMIEAAKTTAKEANKAAILRELSKIPANAQSKQAFREGFEKLGLDVGAPPGQDKALITLAESVTRFYDPDMVPWLVERGEKIKGDADALKDLRAQILQSALKLAKTSDLPKLEQLLDKWGTKQEGKPVYERPLFDLTKKLLQDCGDREACYLDNIGKSDAQKTDTQFKGIKAAYMLGIIGNEKTAEALVGKMPVLENAAVRYSASQAIDHLLPNGSEELSKKLRDIVAKNKETGDRDRIAGDNPLKEVMYRIMSRKSK